MTLRNRATKKKMKYFALAAVILILLCVSYTQLRFAYLKHRLDPIAKQLLDSQSSLDVVFIGNSTAEILKDISFKEGVSWEIRYGDAPAPIGNRKADAYIMYMLDDKEILGLRMSVKWGEVHILGFWTPY